jgi:hypothetical protein
MDLYTYLLSSTGNPIKPKRKGRKPKKAKKIKWGTPHPKGFKNYANKPTAKLDKLLTTLNSNLSVNKEDMKRKADLVQDYGYVMSIPEAKSIVNKNSNIPEFGYEDIKKEAAEAVAKGEIKETDIDEFVMNRAQEIQPERTSGGNQFNLDEVAEQYGKKWESIDRELDDLLTTLNTGGGVETMRKEALRELKKKRGNLLMEGLQQEEFMLEGLTDTNKDFRNKFIDKFKEGQLSNYQKNISSFGEKLYQIDEKLEIKEMDTYGFNQEETLSYSPQEAEQELNLLEKEMNEISTQTEQIQELGEISTQTEQPVELSSVVEEIREARESLSLSRSNSALSRTPSISTAEIATQSATPADFLPVFVFPDGTPNNYFTGKQRQDLNTERRRQQGLPAEEPISAAEAAADKLEQAANNAAARERSNNNKLRAAAAAAKEQKKAEKAVKKSRFKGKVKDPPMPPPSP